MIRVPGDKSISHRALLFAALAQGESRVSGILPGEDCRSTASCLRALGVSIPELPTDGSEIRIVSEGVRAFRSPGEPLDCGNSGTTARLLMGVLAGLPLSATLTGDASLRSRPMRRVTGPLSQMGASFQEEGAADRLPIRVSGGALRPLDYRSPVASAQVKSALLLAGWVGGVGVSVVEPVASRDHTERMLRRMGCRVKSDVDPSAEGGWRVTLEPTRGALNPLDFEVPGDFSSAAFLIAFGLLGGAGGEGVHLGGVGLNPTRISLLGVLERMGGRLRIDGGVDAEGVGEPVGDLHVLPAPLRGTEVGGEEVPGLIDEIPILAALATRAEGVTRIRDAEELRVKESDRISALVVNLRGLGVEVEEYPDGLAVHGSSAPLRGRVQTFHDHRIAMAFGVLGALPGNSIEIETPEMVEVSFPGFWERLASFQGRARSPRHPIVTIDGPAGSGKSTTARSVAQALGFRHLDSGSLYRGLTLALLRSGVPEEAWDRLEEADLWALPIGLEPVGEGFRVLLDGKDPGEALRSSEVTERVSLAARVPAVRARLLDLQREAGRQGGVVADGRDMGTVVFPGADLKVFLVADLGERARRRVLQEGGEVTPEAVQEEAGRLEARDRLDEEREVAPLREPTDATRINTTHLSFEAQVQAIVDRVRHSLGGA